MTKVKKFTQFCCCRSGSTLMFRILRYVFPKTVIERRIPDSYETTEEKDFNGTIWSAIESFLTAYSNLSCHKVEFDANEKIVCTVRNPIDLLASNIRINHFVHKNSENISQNKISDQILDDHIDRISLQQHNFWETVESHDNECLFLKYESFWNNYDYIFDNLESFFNIKIQNQKKESIKNKVSINAAIKIQKKIAESVDYAKSKGLSPETNDILIEEDGNYIDEDGDKYYNYFGYRDKESKIHANHVMTPVPENASQIFTKKQIVLIKEKYTEYIEKWKKL